jgi:hypothetical protein
MILDRSNIPLSFIKENLGRLCTGKAYLSRKICNLIAKYGGEPCISIKKKNIYHPSRSGAKGIESLEKEMLFSCTKAKRGQKKEIRLKVLTYNLAIIARLPAQLD